MNIEEAIEKYQELGYEFEEAESKVCQDIILLKISQSKYSKNITIKGGVVMHSISNDIRRATQDLDFDFIKYSLDDKSIKNFIKTLSDIKDGIKIKIVDKITPLHHQDYAGKRVNLKITDTFDNTIYTKLDIGVHQLFELEQEEYCFSFDLYKNSANLLINSMEQIFTEKLKSLLKLGFRSTRYKDLFDFYYLIENNKLDKDKLINCIEILIFKDETMRENTIQDIINRMKGTLNSQRYHNNLNSPKVNWLEIPIEETIDIVLDYISGLEKSIV